MECMEALYFSEQFSKTERDKDAWKCNPVCFYPGGIRNLYGYMADKRDMENFNQNSHGKSRLKLEMKPYNETVRNPTSQMAEDNELLVWFKNQAAKNQKKAKALEETLSLVNEKHRQTVEENKIIRLKTKMHYEQNKEEIEYQEKFFKNQFKMIYDARIEEEDKFEQLHQEQREMFKQFFANASSSVEDYRVRAEKVEKFINLPIKEIKAFVEEKKILIRTHEERKCKLWEEAMELEKKFDLDLAKLMEKYSPKQSEQV